MRNVPYYVKNVVKFEDKYPSHSISRQQLEHAVSSLRLERPLGICKTGVRSCECASIDIAVSEVSKWPLLCRLSKNMVVS
jgi:hypothetical protein